MISREAFEQFASAAASQEKSRSETAGFDIAAYLSRHGFKVIRRKPWQSHQGGFIFELQQCPFNPEHTSGSAAFTFLDGVPGFTCKHNGCLGKTIKDVFAVYPPEPYEEQESESSTEEGQTQAQILCEIAQEADLFHTPDGEAYAQIRVNDHIETWALRSKKFRSWLCLQFYKNEKKPPASQPLQNALGVLEARAQYESPEMPVFIRVAETAGATYIDLCNPRWQAVEITTQGWRLVDNPPVRFRRAKGMLPLPYPEGGGSLNLLRDLINIGTDDNWILCIAWLIAVCRPSIPHPILIFHGEQGSAKSTMVRLLRRLIDPSTALIRTPPRDERDLVIAGSNSLVLAYDNVSGVRPWLSDALCRVATGGGFSTRQLFTDSEEVLFDSIRPIILNGIDHIADRPDLAERALILYLPTIKKGDRREESDLYAAFEQRLPGIFGGLCDAVSSALEQFPKVELPYKPRMADFARFATASMPAVGFPFARFLAAYDGNQAEAVRDTLEGDPVATAISELLDQRAQAGLADIWEGMCKELLAALEQFADDVVKRSRDWPTSPRSLGGRLRRLVTFLRESGIEIGFHPKGTRGKRLVTIARTTGYATATTASADPNVSSNQSDRSDEPSGGVREEVTEQSRPVGEPPPRSDSFKSFNGTKNGKEEAVVAEEAVVSFAVLDQDHNPKLANRIDLCGSCGGVDWKWVNGCWVCPRCGLPAAGQSLGTDRERFEL